MENQGRIQVILRHIKKAVYSIIYPIWIALGILAVAFWVALLILAGARAEKEWRKMQFEKAKET